MQSGLLCILEPVFTTVERRLDGLRRKELRPAPSQPGGQDCARSIPSSSPHENSVFAGAPIAILRRFPLPYVSMAAEKLLVWRLRPQARPVSNRRLRRLLASRRKILAHPASPGYEYRFLVRLGLVLKIARSRLNQQNGN